MFVFIFYIFTAKLDNYELISEKPPLAKSALSCIPSQLSKMTTSLLLQLEVTVLLCPILASSVMILKPPFWLGADRNTTVVDESINSIWTDNKN